MKKKSVLVTGGAGFIASHITDAYLKKGYRVAIIDNLVTGSRKNLNPKAVFYKADIRNLEAVRQIIQKEKPEVINHHAAIVEVIKSMRDPVATYAVNVIGTANLLVAAIEGGVKKFIFASTGGAIYGEPKKIPADEKTPALPLSPYGFSKHSAEGFIQFYARASGMKYAILRYANVYGPRQNPKGEAGVVAIFAGLISQKIKPTIFGDGSKSRDYVYVGDIVEANMKATQKTNNTITNIGWGKKITDLDIFNAIAKNLEYEGQPNFAPYRKGEVYAISLNASRAKKLIGWSPKVPLMAGIALATAGYKKK